MLITKAFISAVEQKVIDSPTLAFCQFPKALIKIYIENTQIRGTYAKFALSGFQFPVLKSRECTPACLATLGWQFRPVCASHFRSVIL
jgi:hypothetical protein